MAKTKQKNRSSAHSFALGMILYALVFAAISAVGLRFFWSFIDEYEKSRPTTAMDQYIQSLDEEHIRELSAGFVATLDRNVQTEEESYSFILNAVNGELSYAKKSAESTEERLVYIITMDGSKLGRVVLTQQDDDPTFGFSPWTVAEEEMDFSGLLSTKDVTVPDTWTVSCNGNVLDANYHSGEIIHYAMLEEFYDEGFSLPCMVTYHVENFVGDISLTVSNEAGETVELPEGETDQSFFTDNCTDQEKAEIKGIVDNFITNYVLFMSSANGFVWSNYSSVIQYVVPGSDLAVRLAETVEGQIYASSRGDDIVSITLNDSMDLGGGNYYADVTYVVDTTGQKGIVQTTSNLKLIVSQTDSGLKVAAIASY
ncbi:MAG: hypothetical protein SPE18_08945 [Candidatus Limivicinus sp.]|nr:hypothetical protein [Candidatus Limivicinus sp.]